MTKTQINTRREQSVRAARKKTGRRLRRILFGSAENYKQLAPRLVKAAIESVMVIKLNPLDPLKRTRRIVIHMLFGLWPVLNKTNGRYFSAAITL